MMSFFEGDIVNVVNITLSMIILFIVFLNLLELNLSCVFFSAGESHTVQWKLIITTETV